MSVLVVEDNTISLRMLEVMLQSHGFETISAKSGRQAIERLESRSDIQLVVTDLMMPDMDGYQLLEEIASRDGWREIPAVVLTSLSDAETVRRVASLGCRHYLVKPVKEDMLLPKVRLLLRDAGAGAVLRSKFRVLEETGMGVEQYDRLFDAFHAQLQEGVKLLSALGGGVPSDLQIDQLVGMRDGASVLASGPLPALLEGLRSRRQCEWEALCKAVESTCGAMDAAVRKRERIREMAARQDVSEFPGA